MKTENRAGFTSKMSPIKDFTVIYEALKEEHIFSEGDTVTGAVTFTLTEETKVESLFVKMKGDANVHWTERIGYREDSYDAHRRYFKLKEYLVAENSKGTVLPQGDHRYKFKFKIPQEDMPSSFVGSHGKIIYMLEAKMFRSWRLPSKVQQRVKFVSKTILHHGQVKSPQSGSVDKEVGVFSKGLVQLSVTVDRKVCAPGDTLSIVAKISNSSSKTMTPKFSLHEKIVYRAEGKTNISDKSLCYMVGNTITPNSKKTVSCHLTIPGDVTYSIDKCGIISVDHYLQVYLDITLAFDQKVVFPLVIGHFIPATPQPKKAVRPRPGQAVKARGHSDVPTGPCPAPAGPSGSVAPGPSQQANTKSGEKNPLPQQAPPNDFPTASTPAFPTGPYPAPGPGAWPVLFGLCPVLPGPGAGPLPAFSFGPFPVPAGPTAPGAYGYPAPGPTQQTNTTSGYNNPLPQQAPPYNFPTAASPPSSVQHEAPTAPPLSQQGEEPPPYTSLFPPSDDTVCSTESDKKN